MTESNDAESELQLLQLKYEESQAENMVRVNENDELKEKIDSLEKEKAE